MWTIAIVAVIGIALGYGIRIVETDIRAARRLQKPAAFKVESTYVSTIGDRLEAKRPGLPARVREKVQG